MTEYIKALERVAKAAKAIFYLTKFPRRIVCPHGNLPSHLTNAWWCDYCWGELEDALEQLENADASEHDDPRSEQERALDDWQEGWRKTYEALRVDMHPF